MQMRLLKSWTVSRAAGAGSIAGCMAMLLWPAYAAFPDNILLPFLATLSIAAFCGVSMLWITVMDLAAHRTRGNRLLPIRVFDIILGLVLAMPSLLELHAILRT